MADLIQHGQLIRDDSSFPVGWNYKYSSGSGAVIVKGSPGFLHSINLNSPVATTVIKLYDSISAQTGTFAIITIPASPQPVTLFYDITLLNGLTLNIGTSSDITIVYI